jgi:hypothetical protein
VFVFLPFAGSIGMKYGVRSTDSSVGAAPSIEIDCVDSLDRRWNAKHLVDDYLERRS